jgi:hypothetical protein
MQAGPYLGMAMSNVITVIGAEDNARRSGIETNQRRLRTSLLRLNPRAGMAFLLPLLSSEQAHQPTCAEKLS